MTHPWGDVLVWCPHCYTSYEPVLWTSHSTGTVVGPCKMPRSCVSVPVPLLSVQFDQPGKMNEYITSQPTNIHSSFVMAAGHCIQEELNSFVCTTRDQRCNLLHRLISLLARHTAGLFLKTVLSVVWGLECCFARSDVRLLMLLSLLTVSL